MPSVANDFIAAAPDGTAQIMQALAAAESLTDCVAEELCGLVSQLAITPANFIRALHYSDFISPRNSEWHIVPDVRRHFQDLETLSGDLLLSVHRKLKSYGMERDPKEAGSLIPSYLFTTAGQGYHSAQLRDFDTALALYSRAATQDNSGVQWLALKLAEEQEERGVLDRGTLEVDFLRAMTYRREGKRDRARIIFRRIAAVDDLRREVAISCHLLALMLPVRDRDEAEWLLRKSISQNDELGDLRGLTHSMHSLAVLLGPDHSRRDEAEQILWDAFEIANDNNDGHTIAKILHSLANFIGLDPFRRSGAEARYWDSIPILEDIGDIHGVGQVLHSLANLVRADSSRWDEAENLYRRSVNLFRSSGDLHAVAKTLHSLGNLLRRSTARHQDAEAVFLESIGLLEKVGDRIGLAQTIRSLALVVEHRSPEEAVSLLLRSLEINHAIGSSFGVDRVNQTLLRLRAQYRLSK